MRDNQRAQHIDLKLDYWKALKCNWYQVDRAGCLQQVPKGSLKYFNTLFKINCVDDDTESSPGWFKNDIKIDQEVDNEYKLLYREDLVT